MACRPILRCAGDIVRIKSLDFDSQRADVEIIFTFKGTKSGNWDVKTLDKQVDVTPDEDAVMQKNQWWRLHRRD